MRIIGFLNTDGVLFPCSSYGHISKADEIVETFNMRKERQYDLSEDILLKKGWICIRITDVFKSVYDDERNILFITPKQQEFFAKHKADFNERQLAHIESLLKDFGILYKYHNRGEGE